MIIAIRPLAKADILAYLEHFERIRAESGRDGDLHFMPYAPGDKVPNAFDAAAFKLDCGTPGWRRLHVAADGDRIVGHVLLKGDSLQSGLHRCNLGIGLERAYRGRGIGRRLLHAAIEFARGVGTLEWIDLGVFAHNAVARALYRSVGFREIGTTLDRFDVLACI